MTIAFDTTSNVAVSTGNLSWTHTPVGTPKGVIVLISQNAAAGDQVTSVTYGGVSMTEVAGSPLAKNLGDEDGALYGYFLGTGIPTGAQTVFVTVSVATNRRAVCYTVTAATDTEVEDTTATDLNAVANPSVNVTLGGTGAFVAGVMHSGQDDITSIASAAGCTDVLEHDHGSTCSVWNRRTNIETGSGNFAVGWTATIEDSGILAVAIREAITWIPRIIWF